MWYINSYGNSFNLKKEHIQKIYVSGRNTFNQTLQYSVSVLIDNNDLYLEDFKSFETAQGFIKWFTINILQNEIFTDITKFHQKDGVE